MIALLLLLVANDGYAPEARQAYVVRALDAVKSTDPKTLADALNYVNAIDRNKCQSAFRRLRVQCLIEAAAKNCKSVAKEEKDRCSLYLDIIVINALGERQMISESERHRIMEENRDYKSALRAELKRLYGSLAAGFRLSRHYACSGGDTACVARAIDSYCLDQADQQNLAWQHCAAGLVWFIGTSSGGQ